MKLNFMNSEKIQYYKIKDRIIISIPKFRKRTSMYQEGEDLGEYPTLVGLIEYNKHGIEEDYGFAFTIDMTYSGKPDQYSGIMYNYWEGDVEDFKEICTKLGLNIVEYKNK